MIHDISFALTTFQHNGTVTLEACHHTTIAPHIILNELYLDSICHDELHCPSRRDSQLRAGRTETVDQLWVKSFAF